MKWIEVAIKTKTGAVEAVANILYDAGVTGVAIEDPNDLNLVSNDKITWDYVDESFIDTHFEGAVVKGYLPESVGLTDKIELIRKSVAFLPQYGLDIGLGELTATELYEEDWSNSWKQYYRPAKIGRHIIIKPTWENYEKKDDDDIIIEMDPGMAFGTGTHETTMMCAIEIENYVNDKTTFFDIGCGSGILSIIAAKVGAKKVIAVDLDEMAVTVTQRNVEMNRVEDIVEVRQGNLMDVINEKADVIVSNIIADIIILLSEDIKHFLADNGIFIVSGVIIDKLDAVKQSFECNGLEIIKANTMGEWAVIVSMVKGENNE